MENRELQVASAGVQTLQEMRDRAEIIAKSGLFGLKTIEQTMALMLISQAEGRHPALVARDYDIIQGRPSKKAEAMQRDFMQSGGRITWKKLNDTEACAVFSHPQGGEVEITWDIKRANLAGLGSKDIWKKYPRQMLRARTLSEGIRTVCPMATSGMYVEEEFCDMEPRNVTPKKAPAHPAPEKTVEPIENAEVIPPANQPEAAPPTPEPTPEVKEPAEEQKAPPAAPNASSDASTGKRVADQLEKIRKLAIKNGATNRAEILKLVSGMVNREIKDATNLTAEERERLIADMEAS